MFVTCGCRCHKEEVQQCVVPCMDLRHPVSASDQNFSPRAMTGPGLCVNSLPSTLQVIVSIASLSMQNNVLWDITNLDSFELVLAASAVRFPSELQIQ